MGDSQVASSGIFVSSGEPFGNGNNDNGSIGDIKELASALAAAHPNDQKEMLGERLFLPIHEMFPTLASKITGMLLELTNAEILQLLEDREILKCRVEESISVIQHAAYHPKEKPKEPQFAGLYEYGTIQPSSAEVLVQEPEQGPSLSDLAALHPNDQKQLLGEILFPLIREKFPELAGKITGMLLEMDNGEILHLLDDREMLISRAEEASAILQNHMETQTHSCTTP